MSNQRGAIPESAAMSSGLSRSRVWPRPGAVGSGAREASDDGIGTGEGYLVGS